MSVLKTCRPPKRCFPWKCGSQRAPEFTQLTTPRNRTPIRHPVRCCRLACQSGKTQTHIKNLTDTSWLALLSRHKHLHSEVKKKKEEEENLAFPGDSFRWSEDTVSCEWRDAAAEIFLQHPSRPWSESTQAERLKECFGVQAVGCVVQCLRGSAEEEALSISSFVLFKMTRYLINIKSLHESEL